MSALIAATPYFWALASAALAVALLEAYVLVSSRRRAAVVNRLQQQAQQGDWEPLAGLVVPSRAPELVAGLAPLAVAGLWVASVQSARRLAWQGFDMLGMKPKFSVLMTPGVSGDPGAIGVGLVASTLVLLLAGAAVGLAVSVRLRARGLAQARASAAASPEVAAVWARHPGPMAGPLVGGILAFLILGLGPLIRAVLAASAHRISTLDLLPWEDDRAVLLDQLLTTVTEQLKAGLLQARVGSAVAAIIAVALIVTRSPERARARALGRAAALPGHGAWLLGAGLLALSGAAFALARPLQRENELPWPGPAAASDILGLKLETPELGGPDPIPQAPLLTVATDGLAVNNSTLVAQGQLEDLLRTLRHNYRLLHPYEPLLPDQLLVACARRTPRERLTPALAVAAHAGFDRPVLVFLRPEQTVRPLLGARSRTVWTGAAFKVVASADQAEAPTTVVEAAAFRDCSDLAARIVQLRTEGMDVTVVVGRP